MIRLLRHLIPIISGDSEGGLDTRTTTLPGSGLPATLANPEVIDRRRFFALGAGIVGGLVVRQAARSWPFIHEGNIDLNGVRLVKLVGPVEMSGDAYQRILVAAKGPGKTYAFRQEMERQLREARYRLDRETERMILGESYLQRLDRESFEFTVDPFHSLVPRGPRRLLS